MEKLSAILPGWETVRMIGSGSSGRVYELKKKDEYGGDYSSALKVITIPSTQKEYDEMKDTMSEFAMRSKLRDKVQEISNEYRLMGSLRGHPNIVNCEDQMIVPHDDDLGWDIYIRMELLSSLPDYAVVNGMPEGEIIKLGVDICSALELCRANGIIHRDIKPQNIFVNKYGSFKLGDFGVAKAAKIRGSADMAGTYSYMAPEVYKGRPYDDRVDIYSLGMVLYCLLNGQRGPFLPLDEPPTREEVKLSQQRRFNGEPLPAPKYGSNQLKKIVMKACAYDPADRFDGPFEFKKALLTLNGERPAESFVPIDDELTVRDGFTVVENEKRQERPAPLPIFEEKPLPKKQPEPVKKEEIKPEAKDNKAGRSSIVAVIAVLVAILAVAGAAIAVFLTLGNNVPPDEPDPTPTPTQSVEPTKEIKINAVVLSAPRLMLTEGESARLTVSCIPEPEPGMTQPEYVWKSSDTEIATVDESGVVQAVKEGAATVMVYIKDKMELYDECMVIVDRPTVENLVIEQMPVKTVYMPGEELDTEGLVLRAEYNNGTAKTVSDPNEYTVTCEMSGMGSKTVVISYDGATTEYTIRISLFG